ncbi:hypothetical protein Dimus_039073 [Dionaea muscipula]
MWVFPLSETEDRVWGFWVSIPIDAFGPKSIPVLWVSSTAAEGMSFVTSNRSNLEESLSRTATNFASLTSSLCSLAFMEASIILWVFIIIIIIFCNGSISGITVRSAEGSVSSACPLGPLRVSTIVIRTKNSSSDTSVVYFNGTVTDMS